MRQLRLSESEPSVAGMLVLMASLVRSHLLGRSSERVLITSLVIVLFSTLLFAIGVAGATYESADGASVSRSSVQSPSLQTSDRTDIGAVLSAGPRAATVLNESPGSTTPVSAVLCVLGLMCGLVFTTLWRGLCRRPPLRDRGSARVLLPSVPAPFFRPRETALSLTQLSLSRT